MQIKSGIDKLVNILNRIYFKVDVLKYILPDEITRNNTKATNQNFVSTRTNDFFVFGQEKIADFDSSINSFVGCCSLGTGHFDSFMKLHLRKSKIISITPERFKIIIFSYFWLKNIYN